MIAWRDKLKRNKMLVIILGGLILIFIICLLLRALFFTAIQSQSFYAVFLDNGQVYFGKVTRQTANEIVLEYVFYLKANTDLSSDESPNANLSLVKLGNEIYKPRDRMLINRSHVLFLEEMRQGSEVMRAIEKYEQQSR